MYPADGVSLPSPTHSPMPRYYSSLYSSSTHAHSSIDRSHHPDDMAAVGVQAQLDALHRQGEIQRAMLANLCQQLGVNRSNADTTTNRATIDTSSPSVLLSTLATLQQQLSVALQENVALQSENSHLRRELDQIEQLVTRTRSSLSVNTQSLTTANSISSLNNNTSSSYNSPNPLHRSYRSNPSNPSNPSDTLT
ncbi:hypothetical protein BDF22DRAFT_265404 [Syncephalis plumigaleata]|nr:hypothetical protein BDF22DRAFT_265404 [Syncephalis plumigaleata]